MELLFLSRCARNLPEPFFFFFFASLRVFGGLGLMTEILSDNKF